MATTVWPALLPPCERTTMCTLSARRSMTLPLPSSPHWPPTRMVTLMAERRLADAGIPVRFRRVDAGEILTSGARARNARRWQTQAQRAEALGLLTPDGG